MKVYPREEATLSMCIGCRHLDWQVSSTAQIFDALSPVISAVEHLTLKHERYAIPSAWRNEADRTQWRKLLGSFGNVKTLRAPNGLVRELSRSLRSDNGEHPLGLVPDVEGARIFRGGQFRRRCIHPIHQRTPDRRSSRNPCRSLSMAISVTVMTCSEQQLRYGIFAILELRTMIGFFLSL
jgi:hypothetical protein